MPYKNKKDLLENVIKRYKYLKSLGVCPRCSTKTTGTVFCKKCMKDNCEKRRNNVSATEKRKEYYNRLKEIVYFSYGNTCAWCGQSDSIFFTIDHVNNDGAKQRKNKEHRESGIGLYKYIIDNNFPKTFQILCFNCNCAKQYRGLTKDYFNKFDLFNNETKVLKK